MILPPASLMGLPMLITQDFTFITHLKKMRLEENEMKCMYASGLEGNAGTINGLYTFYSVLNRLFRFCLFTPR
jgi:hypothetical protein